MIYFTISPIELVKYHINKQLGILPDVIEVDSVKDIYGVLIKGTSFKKSINLINASRISKGEMAKFVYKQGAFNTTYIVLNESCYKEFQKKYKASVSVKGILINPDLYKSNLLKLKSLFEDEAYEWIWDKFKYNPSKLDKELNRLLLSVEKKKYSRKELVDMYEGIGGVYAYRQYIGSIRGTELLSKMSDKELWMLVVGGNKTPCLFYKFLVEDTNRKPLLYHYLLIVREAVQDGLIPVRIGAILFNEWVRYLSLPREEYITISSEQVKRLSRLNRG
ncbi:hypothetical protein H6G33_10535 [Calothrix sp. FACHB-1219]|uniref:hypothetical protein n=1 Tax=unclassified Calothrix TaxID=2619626 RepID=UPI0016875BC2|nr:MULTISPECIES: hypothetical protein [unclassified Calothrix]MBD2201784.1 hypothetical protein [Calothrix sp. FACHB-168]MBD2217470.1 hypothetical protein [Calothrix sp. FACHB-1219]